MKKGINMLLSVDVGLSVDLCEKIEFIFKQGDISVLFEYPSERAIKEADNVVGLVWTPGETAQFTSGIHNPVKMDTRITLKDSPYQPETEITTFTMTDTLFEGAN